MLLNIGYCGMMVLGGDRNGQQGNEKAKGRQRVHPAKDGFTDWRQFKHLQELGNGSK